MKFFLELCLLSVRKAMLGIEGEILVIDNQSVDGSRDFFHNRFPEVTFCWNATNTGFARACNQGWQMAKGDLILFLNPDTILAEDCLARCISFLRKKNSDGALGIRMIDGTGRFLKESKRSFPSPTSSLYRFTGLAAAFPHSRIFARYRLGHLSDSRDHEVEVLAGAFMLIPASILEKTGGFDEDFFMYGEDIDLSYRIRKAGFKNYYFSQSTIVHFKGESTQKDALPYVRKFYGAMNLFVRKHYAGSNLWVFRWLLHFAIFLRASISGVSRAAGMAFRSPEIQASAKKKLVIEGSESEFEEIVRRLGTAEKDVSVSRMTVTEGGGSGLNLPKDTDVVIFCEGSMSFRQIIEAIEKVPATVDKLVFARGGHALVGSHDQKRQGEVVPLKPDRP